MSKTLLQQSQLHNSKDYTLPGSLGATLESGAASLSDDLNAMRAMLKDVTGKANWYEATDQDLAQIYAAVQVSGANTALQGTLTVASGLTSLAGLTASGVVDLSAVGQATTVYGTLDVDQLATFNGGVEIAADTIELANNSHMNLLGNADITVAALAGDGWVVRADATGKLVDGANMVFKDATGLDLFAGNFTVSPAGKVLIGGNEIQDSAGNKVISFGSVTSVADSVIIEKNMNVKGDIVVDGDFNVKGTMTTIDTLNIKVKDAVIMLANGDPAPDTSGLVLHGAAGALDLALGQHGKNGQWIMAKVDGSGVNGTDPQMNLVGADLAELVAGGIMIGKAEDVVLGSFAPTGAGSLDVSMTAANGLFFNVRGDAAVSLADVGDVAAFASMFSGESILAAITTSSTAVSNEASRALAAEGSIASDLSSEASTARSAELVLTNNLSSEVSRAGSAEAGLQSAIDAINAYVQDSFVVGTAMMAGAEVDFSSSVGALAAGSFASTAAAKKVLDVYLNGVRLAYGAGKDYVITAAGKLAMGFDLEADDVFFLVNRAPAA